MNTEAPPQEPSSNETDFTTQLDQAEQEEKKALRSYEKFRGGIERGRYKKNIFTPNSDEEKQWHVFCKKQEKVIVLKRILSSK